MVEITNNYVKRFTELNVRAPREPSKSEWLSPPATFQILVLSTRCIYVFHVHLTKRGRYSLKKRRISLVLQQRQILFPVRKALNFYTVFGTGLLSQYCGFYPVSITPPMLLTHLHHRNVLIRRTGGRNLANFGQRNAVSNIGGSVGTKVSSRCFHAALQMYQNSAPIQ